MLFIRHALRLAPVVVVLLLLSTSLLSAQRTAPPAPRLLGTLAEAPAVDPEARPTFRSEADSLDWHRAFALAERASGQRLVIALHERLLFWLDGADTLLIAPVAVGSGDTLSFGREEWEFSTPRGRRIVRLKEESPVWVPPLWHYVEYARKTGRELVELRHGRPVALADGSRILVRGNRVGRLLPEGEFIPYEPGEQIVFEDRLFVPPFGTVNRRITGELGEYKLDLGEAILIHGTPHQDSIGTAATHGCIRMRDEDLEILYRSIPVGTPVYIY